VAPGACGRPAILRVSDDPSDNGCRPSADYLFRSLAEHFPGRATGVVLTGMGADGVRGLRDMRRAGCTVIAQDAATCVVYGMPKEAVDAGVVDVIAPLQRIAAEICRTVKTQAGPNDPPWPP
jgi:two-component system chemotaxis response regulator CheB